MTKTIRFVLTIIAAVLLSGCHTIGYKYNAGVPSRLQAEFPLKIAVLNFATRPGGTHIRFIKVKPGEQLASGFADVLRHGRKFEEVRHVELSSSAVYEHLEVLRDQKIDAVFVGDIQQFKYTSGPRLEIPLLFLWPLSWIGIPVGPVWYEKQINLCVRLLSVATGETLWESNNLDKAFETKDFLSWSSGKAVDERQYRELLDAVVVDLKSQVDRGVSRELLVALITPKDERFAELVPSVVSLVSQDTGVLTRWAVVIGVSQYLDTQIPSLRYASADAQSFYDWLVSPSGGKYAPSRVKLLVNRQATCENIKDALFVWLKQALAEDMVTIYFAGHGSPESPDAPKNLFLLPFDVRYDSISTTGFPMWDIKTAFKRYIKAKKVVIIADACHSGGVGQSFGIARRANRALKVNSISTGIHSLSKVGDGICVISASDEKQFSQESKDWGGGHGVFTYFLLTALKGDADYNKDKSVTLGELTSYLSQEVRRATKNAQSPTVAGRYDPALTIGK